MALWKESIEWNKIYVAGGLIGCVGGCILCTGSDAEKGVGVVVRGLKARHKYGLGSWCGRTPAENKWLVQHDEISDLLDKSWYSQWYITRIANAIPCHSLLVIFQSNNITTLQKKRGLCLMKCSSKTLQNLPYFWNTKTHMRVHLVFYIPKIRHILNHFTLSFHQA